MSLPAVGRWGDTGGGGEAAPTSKSIHLVGFLCSDSRGAGPGLMMDFNAVACPPNPFRWASWALVTEELGHQASVYYTGGGGFWILPKKNYRRISTSFGLRLCSGEGFSRSAEMAAAETTGLAAAKEVVEKKVELMKEVFSTPPYLPSYLYWCFV